MFRLGLVRSPRTWAQTSAEVYIKASMSSQRGGKKGAAKPEPSGSVLAVDELRKRIAAEAEVIVQVADVVHREAELGRRLGG